MLKFILSFFISLSLLADDQIAKEQLINRLNEYIATYNAGNFEALKSFWTEDSSFYSPVTGQETVGREAIINLFKTRYSSLKGAQVKFNIFSFNFPKPEEAIIEASFERIPGDGTKRARRIELIKTDGKWLIKSIREIDVDDPPNLYDHLKPLEWLIGKWNDKDEDVTIRFETKWDKYRNFILQHFTTIVYGLEELEGRQIIGWDPEQEKIRSWIFDSDGGFGSGLWTLSDKSWQVEISYTLSDGRLATATDIYTPLDANSYTFSSVGRNVDGEFLPNLDPVTVYKEKP